MHAARTIALLVGLTFLAVDAAAELTTRREQQPLTLGAGIVWQDKFYRDYSDSHRLIPVPVIFYEGEKFFARGDTLGWKLVEVNNWEIAPVIEFGLEGYDSGASDFLDGMRDRHPWIAAGGHIIWQPGQFGGKFTAATDITDESNGARFVAEAFYDTRTGNFDLNGNAGVLWGSEGYSDYYYGVERDEAIPGRPAYSAGGTANIYLGGSARYQREKSPWMLIAYGRYIFFDDDINDSPITNDDRVFTFGAGIGYTFGR